MGFFQKHKVDFFVEQIEIGHNTVISVVAHLTDTVKYNRIAGFDLFDYFVKLFVFTEFSSCVFFLMDFSIRKGGEDVSYLFFYALVCGGCSAITVNHVRTSPFLMRRLKSVCFCMR